MLKLTFMAGIFLLAISVQAGSQQECGEEAKACLKYGASVFQMRCSLCHGSDGHGEGILSMAIKSYPGTNLLEIKHGKDKDALYRIIKFGGSLPEISTEMPPWGDELTVTQLDSVVMFVEFLRADTEKALTLLHEQAKLQKPSLRVGRGIFLGRCALCHGKDGDGKGKMARIIKDPPPFNLTQSRVPEAYLKEMISKGGKAMGRSPRMPPFGTDLSDSEIDSVIIYLKTLRE